MLRMETNKTPHSPQKMNILGRKRYSGDANAKDVIEYSFDDTWRAIGRLYGINFCFFFVLIFIFKRDYANNSQRH